MFTLVDLAYIDARRHVDVSTCRCVDVSTCQREQARSHECGSVSFSVVARSPGY